MERIREFEEEIKDRIASARKRLREIVNMPMELENEGGIATTFNRWKEALSLTRDVLGDLEALFWLNKLKEQEEQKV